MFTNEVVSFDRWPKIFNVQDSGFVSMNSDARYIANTKSCQANSHMGFVVRYKPKIR